MIVKEREDRQKIRINGQIVQADEFAWDGCHKIYIVTDQKSRDELEGYGYDFFPIAELQDAWDMSCGLRFINDANLSKSSYIPQGWGEPLYSGECDYCDDYCDECWEEAEILI